MSESLACVEENRPYAPLGWAIYNLHGRVEKRIDIGPVNLRIAQHLASVVCVKTNLPLSYLTDRKQNQPRSRMRQYFIYTARHIEGVSFPKIGKMLDRDHTTIMSAYRRISAEFIDRPGSKYSRDLVWVMMEYQNLRRREDAAA